MIKVELQGSDQLIAKLNQLPDKFRDKLYVNLKIEAEELRTFIQEDELSGQLLNVRSGDLRASITEEVTRSSGSVIGEVFSAGNLPYARPLNDGCGPYDIEGAFGIKGLTVHHPGQKARHYMEEGLAHQKASIIEAIQGSLKGAWLA